MKAKYIFEFQKTGSIKAGLDIGGVELLSEIGKISEDLINKKEELEFEAYLEAKGYLSKMLEEKKITAYLYEFNPIYFGGKTYKEELARGEMTIFVKSISYSSIEDMEVILISDDERFFKLYLSGKVYIHK